MCRSTCLWFLLQRWAPSLPRCYRISRSQLATTWWLPRCSGRWPRNIRGGSSASFETSNRKGQEEVMASPEKEARALLKDAKIQDIPVPVERIAKQLQARLSFEPFEGNISGMLYRDGKRIVIGVNSAHANTRQR